MSQATNINVATASTVGRTEPANFTAEINDIVNALLSSHSGSTEPTYKAAGTIWRDSDDDKVYIYDGTAWVEMFHQGSIIGTVSQSGGIPTGGLLEYGSNANGEYMRFADGTQICWRRIALTAQDINTAYGSLYRSGNILAGAQTYAASFSAAPTCEVTVHTEGLTTMQAVGGTGDVNNTPSTAYAVNTSAVTNRNIFANYVAVGRWY